MDQKKPLGLSLVIPCFNEVKNIDPLLKKLEALASSVEFPFEVIVVDGNSDDGTDTQKTRRLYAYGIDGFCFRAPHSHGCCRQNI